MKKSIVALALVVAVGIAGMNIAEARWGGGGYGCQNGGGPSGCNGSGCNQNSDVDSQAFEDFYDETADLREQMFDLRQDYFEIMNQETPDKEAAAEAWGEMFDLKTLIQEKAEAAGIQKGFGMRGGTFPGASAGNSPCGGSANGNCWKNQPAN